MDWGAIYTRLATTCGWTWEYIDAHVTLPRLQEMSSYWRRFPPLHEAFAAWAGIAGAAPEPAAGPRAGTGAKAEDELNADVMRALLGAGADGGVSIGAGLFN